MGRYQSSIRTDRDPDELADDIEDYLKGEGFSLIDEKENVWKKGMGLMLGPQYLSYEVQPGKLLLDAWIKFALLPGVYMGEMGIDGFFAFIPKSKLKARVRVIERMAK